ncbi:MAG: hypothetical protein K8R16_11730 [Anaerolineales bacterium]|nr:hypothetical protein [Anaerolineales bacterium]
MNKYKPQRSFSIILCSLFLILSLSLLAGCGSPSPDSSLEETIMALAVDATVNAMDQGNTSEDQNQSEVDPNAQLTQVAGAVQATLDAAQPISEPQPTLTPEEETAPVLSPPAGQATEEVSVEDFNTWMKSANILLYEDIAGVYTTTRYVQDTLDAMGLDYVDVKDAVGTYKEQLLSGGPGGEGWDLIISAKEARGHVKGEMYVYLNDALNDGSSVIIEEWQLDSIVRGKIAIILSRCGVEYQDQWAWDPIKNQLLWQVDGSLPIHHQPNEGISMTNPSGFWPSADLGDFMRLAPGSDAVPLWTARVNVKDTFLTAVSCLDNRLIIQTYSTHNYGKDRVVLVWENYIYNALLARYQTVNE